MDSSVSAEEAARMLGVSRQTLYAYVSRGLITALPGPDQRQSRYAREAVAELAERRRRGRRPKEIAKTALDWGLPVLETKLTLIERERLYFRGVDAVALSEEASLEDVACLLWQVDKDEAFGDAPPAFDPRVLDFVASRPGPAFRDDLLARFAIIAEDADTAAWQQERARVAAGCGGLVRLLAAAMFGVAPTAAPAHLQCAAAWRLDAAGADAVRRALVLCAEHELNASSFTARCIASTGASLKAAVIGGLAALSGGRHGGATSRVETLWRGLDDERDPAPGLGRILASGAEIPGFGHPLYPSGDVRAKAILAEIGERLPRAGAIATAVHDLTGRHPSIDFALVALRRALGLPEDAAFGLFALGRSVGWIAQALEQRADGTLIRPRAIYTGPPHGPEEPPR